MKNIIAILLATGMSFAVSQAAPDWSKVAAELGKSGTQSGEVYRVGLPRSDLHVTLDGIVLKPTLALGSWLAFAPMGPNGGDGRSGADGIRDRSGHEETRR